MPELRLSTLADSPPKPLAKTRAQPFGTGPAIPAPQNPTEKLNATCTVLARAGSLGLLTNETEIFASDIRLGRRIRKLTVGLTGLVNSDELERKQGSCAELRAFATIGQIPAAFW